MGTGIAGAKDILKCLTMIFVVSAAGCDVSAPRVRMGTLPTPPPGPRFENPDKLGKHSYYFNPFETNGIVYACKGGHIDITHVRWAADHTRYLAKRIRKALVKKKKGVNHTMAMEASRHEIRFSYPENWDHLSKQEKKRIANEVALIAAPYVAYGAVTWHEILTWFDVHFAGIEPEFNSSFSWEDNYSNLLGARLAVEAMKDSENSYDKAMTLALDRELKRLGVQSKKVAIKASEKMRGKWYTGVLIVSTTKKNLDIGIDDGYVTPTLVPGVCDGVEAEPMAVPTLDGLSEFGVGVDYQIYPNEWERGRFLKIVYPDGGGRRIRPAEHFGPIMNYVAEQAVNKYGYDID